MVIKKTTQKGKKNTHTPNIKHQTASKNNSK